MIEDVYVVVGSSLLITTSVFVPSEFLVIVAVAPLLLVYVVSEPEVEVEDLIPSRQLLPPKYVHKISPNNSITKSSKISLFIV
jgi:hypothetical protein